MELKLPLKLETKWYENEPQYYYIQQSNNCEILRLTPTKSNKELADLFIRTVNAEEAHKSCLSSLQWARHQLSVLLAQKKCINVDETLMDAEKSIMDSEKALGMEGRVE